MYSRVTLLEVDLLRIDADAAVEAYRRQVLPQLRAQPGFAGVYVMVNGDGQGMVMTLWADAQAMEASTPLASEAIEQFVTVFRAPPGRERYEVRLAELEPSPVPSG